ncbi:MAG: hypothetical protein OEV94_00505 [Deltaproteobacteria bacterium]|nr:hypothetical protein [Deltaproteobacteria bacterium]
MVDFTLLTYAGRFLFMQPLSHYLVLDPWHQLLVLGVLAALAGVGVHHLLGWVAGWYKVSGSHSYLLALSTQWLLVAWVVLLAASYEVGWRSPLLVDYAILPPGEVTDQVSSKVGERLLAPALDKNPRMMDQGSRFTRVQLDIALHDLAPDTYRQALGEAADGLAYGPSADGVTVMAAMALHWVSRPGQTPPPWYKYSEPEMAEGDFPMADFLAALAKEIPRDEVLTRAEWEYVTGKNFLLLVEKPLLVGYLRYYAATSAVLVTLLLMLYLSNAARVKRWLRRRAERRDLELGLVGPALKKKFRRKGDKPQKPAKE